MKLFCEESQNHNDYYPVKWEDTDTIDSPGLREENDWDNAEGSGMA